MPTPNDLTPEEEAAFANHGVAPAGPGVEPNGEPQAAPAPAAEAAPAPVVEERPRLPNGQFAPVAAAPAAVEPPAVVDPNAPPEPAAPPPGFVPHAALHAERVRAQQAMQQNQLLQTRMNALLAGQGASPTAVPQPVTMPDLETDPVGYVRALQERLDAFENERLQDQQFRQIDSQITQDEQMFAQYTPDYEQASDHYVQSRAQELLQFYPPQEAQRIMMQEARQIAQQAWSRGIPAAQMIYQMAQARGYRSGAPVPPQMGLPGPSTAPFTPAPAPTAPAASPSAVVASIQAGQAASRSLSGATGGATPATLNAEAILAMSDEEFEAAMGLGTKGANARFASIGG